MHKALDDAIKMGLIARNVCEAVSPPRKQHKEINPLTAEQSRRLLDAAKGHPQEALFVLALATDMRRGELLGLKWQDINFATGVLHVRRALSRLLAQMGRERDDLYIEAEPKTRSSRRGIALPHFAVEALKQHRIHQGEMRPSPCINRSGPRLRFPVDVRRWMTAASTHATATSLRRCALIEMRRRSGRC